MGKTIRYGKDSDDFDFFISRNRRQRDDDRYEEEDAELEAMREWQEHNRED